jgi:hypothetical protein
MMFSLFVKFLTLFCNFYTLFIDCQLLIRDVSGSNRFNLLIIN